MKKSISVEQTLCMNRTDFERGGKSKKWGYNFTIGLASKRQAMAAWDDESALAFITLAQDDDIASGHIAAGGYSFSINNKYDINDQKHTCDGRIRSTCAGDGFFCAATTHLSAYSPGGSLSDNYRACIHAQ